MISPRGVPLQYLDSSLRMENSETNKKRSLSGPSVQFGTVSCSESVKRHDTARECPECALVWTNRYHLGRNYLTEEQVGADASCSTNFVMAACTVSLRRTKWLQARQSVTFRTRRRLTWPRRNWRAKLSRRFLSMPIAFPTRSEAHRLGRIRFLDVTSSLRTTFRAAIWFGQLEKDRALPSRMNSRQGERFFGPTISLDLSSSSIFYRLGLWSTPALPECIAISWWPDPLLRTPTCRLVSVNSSIPSAKLFSPFPLFGVRTSYDDSVDRSTRTASKIRIQIVDDIFYRPPSSHWS